MLRLRAHPRLVVAAVLVLVLLAAAVVAIVRTGDTSPRQGADRAPKLAGTAGLLQTITDQLAGGPSAASAWPGVSPTCYRCSAALGVASALLARIAGDAQDLRRAEATFDQAIRRHQTASGGFAADTADTMPDEINTMFMATELGSALLLLRDRLPKATASRWTASLVRAAGYLDSPDQVTFYVNGNIQLGRVLAFATAWKVTGKAVYQRDYARELSFAQHPPGPRWAGWGFVQTTAPTKQDGTDGAGYFTEAAGDRRPGYDPDYTQLQSDQLSRLYLVTHDPQVLNLLDEVTNQLAERLNRANLQLDTSAGSRHPAAHQWRYYFSPAPAVLTAAGRTGFGGLTRVQQPIEAGYFPLRQSLAQPGNVYAIGNALVSLACVEHHIALS